MVRLPSTSYQTLSCAVSYSDLHILSYFHVSYLGISSSISTDTFQVQYTQLHTSLFLDAAHSSTTSGFLPGALGPDPKFGLCLQCAALDRARLKSTPPIARSPFCSQCFTQYCYDPSSSPTPGSVVGRKLLFVDPNPQAKESVAQKYKIPIIVVSGVVSGILLALCAGWYVFPSISLFLEDVQGPKTMWVRFTVFGDAEEVVQLDITGSRLF